MDSTRVIVQFQEVYVFGLISQPLFSRKILFSTSHLDPDLVEHDTKDQIASMPNNSEPSMCEPY